MPFCSGKMMFMASFCSLSLAVEYAASRYPPEPAAKQAGGMVLDRIAETMDTPEFGDLGDRVVNSCIAIRIVSMGRQQGRA